MEELADAGHRGTVAEVEPGLYGITIKPSVGIGQRALLVQTSSGNLLWDPNGYLDDDLVAAVHVLGGLAAVAASHPHMFGVQVEWSHRFGGVPVYVQAADREWLQRDDPVITIWEEKTEVLPGVVLHRIGGHFPGSAVAHFVGADGRGVLLSGDTVACTPDEHWVSFMRSFPNKIPCRRPLWRRWLTGCCNSTSTGSTTTSAGRSSATPPSGCADPPTATSRGFVGTSTTSPVDHAWTRFFLQWS